MGPATTRHHRIFPRQLLLGFFALLQFAGLSRASDPWWNEKWPVRKKITVDLTANGIPITEPVGSTAVLIRLHGGNFGFTGKEDGGDLRFVADDHKTALPFHIESFNSMFGEAQVWVKVPDLKPGAQTVIWLYYGNQGPDAVKADDAKGTYDTEMSLVYHFAEKGGSPADSTANGNHAQGGVCIEGAMTAGGIRLGPKGSPVIPSKPSLAWTSGGAMTWSAWIKPSALQPNAVIFSRFEGANSFVIGLNNGMPFVEVKVGGGTQRSGDGPAIQATTWHHLAVTASGPQISIYLDGELYGSPLSVPLPAMDRIASLGADTAAESPGVIGFAGEVDELNLAKVARAPGFIKFAAFSQGGEKAAKLLTFGPEEAPTNWMSWMKSGTFGVIIGSLTFDGWVVIGILAVMAVVSWWVMFSKVSYLNGMAKGNAIFMKEWRHVAADLTVLDDDDENTVKTLAGRMDKKAQRAMKHASVYRIYHIGVEEIRHRLKIAAEQSQQRGLPGRSIQAIRASLDGGLVRETQKINKLIVLLTICISGGPFLGLLGTVIGVMITFAAVAAAGEVNVNAIAPGIAAALLATVAGLAVAIPALFGYNYILSRVKDAKDDMHIFIDEFATKMAEFYKDRNA